MDEQTINKELNLGLSLHEGGRLKEAEIVYRNILKEHPDNPEALHRLGMLAFQVGKGLQGLPLLQRAVELVPNDWRYHNSIGVVLRSLGNHPAAEAHLKKAISLTDPRPDLYMNLAFVYRDTGRAELALSAAKQVLALDPKVEEAQLVLWESYKKMVPHWHFPMLNDERRNSLYEQAISKHAKDKNVLEIGTGSGLLAMMAARAGAKHVYTCESVATIAQVASENINKNGFSDDITVFAKSSLGLKIDEDTLPARCDVLVAELFDSGLLGEDALRSFRHARSHLLTKEAKIIPQAAEIIAMPIESQALLEQARVQSVAGFDLNAFNVFQTRPNQPLYLPHYDYKALAKAQMIYCYNFQQGELEQQQKQVSFKAQCKANCHGIAYWFKLILGDDCIYDNAPDSSDSHANSHWLHCVQIFADAVELKRHQEMKLLVTPHQKFINFDPILD